MTETIELPSMPSLRSRISRENVARSVLRLQLTRAYDGLPLTRRDRLHIRRARDFLVQAAAQPSSNDRPSAARVEIARLYQELAEIDASADTATGDADRGRKLARLRELQHAEADRTERWFNAHHEFDPKAARNALRDARRLVARHARPT